MPGISRLEDLIIWKGAMDLCESVYGLTKHFPKYEQYGLTLQMRKAAVSVPSNIAEGFGRRSKKEFKQFLSFSLGSLSELRTQILIAHRIGYLKNNGIKGIDSEIDKLGKQISSFLRKVRVN
jgi:four helix bundle protein